MITTKMAAKTLITQKAQPIHSEKLVPYYDAKIGLKKSFKTLPILAMERLNPKANAISPP